MKTVNVNSFNSAYPSMTEQHGLGNEGLSKREYIATEMMSALVNAEWSTGTNAKLAGSAVAYTDALLAELSK